MKEKLAKNWEKVILGVSLAVLAAYFVVGVAMAKKNPLIPQAKNNTRQLDQELKTRPVELPAKPDMLGHISGAFGPSVVAAPGEPHVYTRPPQLAVNVEVMKSATPDLRVDPKKKPVFNAPTLTLPVAEPGSIKLSWSDSPNNKNIKPDEIGYILLRKGPGETGFKKLTPEPIAERNYTDSRVEPKQSYDYQVTARVTNDEVAAKLAERELTSEPLTVTAVSVLELELKGVAEIPLEPDQPAVPTAQLMIKKFLDGKWKTKLYLVRKGDKVGDGDLATGYEVLDLARVTLQHTDEYVVPKFDDKGVKVGEEKKQRTREVQTWELKYKDDAGKEQKLHPTIGAPRTPAPAPAPAPAPK